MSMLPTPNLSTIDYDDENNFLIFNMKGTMTLEEYKEYFFSILKKAKEHKCRYWIYDLSEFEYDSLQARMWKVSVFLPKCFRELNQELIIGMIPPPNAIHRMGVETAIKSTEKMNYAYQLSYFANQEKAIDWILNKRQLSVATKNFN